MKKKILALLLVATMACSVVACGSEPTEQNPTENIEENENITEQEDNNENNDKNENIDIEKFEIDEERGVAYIDKDIVLKNIETVTLTMDNWSQYFDDYDYVEHIEETNAFGDVESERDIPRYGFGMKNEYLGACNGVAFKFSGKKEKVENIYVFKEETSEDLYINGYKEYIVNEPIIKMLDENGSVVGTAEGEIVDYFLAELEWSMEGEPNQIEHFNFTDYECLDVIGEIKVLKIPNELRDIEIWITYSAGSQPLEQYLRNSFE